MQMDPNIMRDILLQTEAHPAGQIIYRFNVEGHDEVEVNEHVELLIDAGLLEGKVIRIDRGLPVRSVVKRLTFAGHQFLATARNDTIWKKVIARAKEKGMSTSMTVINGLLEAAAKKYAGLE